MRNQPTPIYSDAVARANSAFNVDAEPGVRLWWLFVAMTLPLLVVAGRLIYLQGFVAEGFAVETQQESESFEPIPARNGRIVASDGTVLAFDDERYRLLVHYRWLEEPPNERWLRDEALARLSRSERRDKGRVEQAKADVLARREVLWQSLAELAEVNPDKLADRRHDIQQRVERIHRLVEERASIARSASEKAEHREPENPSLALRGNPAQRAWDVVKHELTTTPTRERRDPLRIAEQSDYHLLLDDVSREVVAEIETQPEQYPGVRTYLDSRRIYPHGRVAPHLVGYRGEIDADELKARHERFPNGDPLDYQLGDSVGRSGIEKSYEHILRGVRGQRKIVRDRHGTIVRNEIVTPPKPGRDVVLNLSVALQEQATTLLEEVVDPAESSETVPRGGCIVAIDVQTGAVLAAAVAPTFDVNDFLSGSDDVRQTLNADPRRPMFPRVTQMKLPPGSVFKTVSAVAVLESHRIDPDHQFECVGYLKDPKKLRCYTFSHFGHGHYGTDLTKAIAQSCNVYFFKAAQTLGPQPLVQWADEFGFGERTGIDVPGEIRGHVPRPPEPPTKSGSKAKIELASHERHGDGDDSLRPASPWESEGEPSSSAKSASAKREPWYEGDTLGLAIGQSRLAATPLQTARMMAAVANDGWLVTPHVAREISAGFVDAAVASTTIEPNRHRLHGLSDGTLARVREGLEQVVAHPQGTGFKTVRMKEVAIAGKTGTAEIGNGKPDHAWFAGYVPADRPRIAFVIVLEQAGSGGKVAGPVAKRFVQLLQEHGLVRGQ